MKALRDIVLFLSLALLPACGARKIETAESSPPPDPRQKLAQARVFYLQEGQPARAEVLINEAINEFKGTGDDRGLADAYHQYAYLLATWNGHMEQSITYFDRASPIYARLKRFDRLADNSVGRGIAYTNLRNPDEACASFDQGISFRDEAVRLDPAARLSVPKGYDSWDSYMTSLRKWAGCGG